MEKIEFCDAYEIIRESFSDPPINVSKENCPSYSGFLTYHQFIKEAKTLIILGIPDIGCVGIEKKSDIRYKIKYLCVRKSHRHKGLGHLLMRDAEKYIENQGGRRIQLGMLYDHKALLAFYCSLDYKITKKKSSANKLTIAFMEKKL